MNSPAEVSPANAGRGFSVTVAAVIVCLVFAALAWKTRQYTTPAPLGAERADERAKALGELRAAEAEALQNPAWIDQDKGLVRLPIQDALRVTVQQWQNPAQARTALNERVEKAFYVPPPPPPKPSEFE
jgi:hypothetical protein